MDATELRDYELDIIVKAWRDERFRKALLKNPKEAILKAFDFEVPTDMNIFVHVEDEHNLHLIVPKPPKESVQELSDDELRDVIGGVMSTGHAAHGPTLRERIRYKNMEQENAKQRQVIERLNQEIERLKNVRSK